MGSVLVFLDRSGGPGRFLEWKVAIFMVGATLAIAGIYLDERWLTGTAIVVLAAGILLRAVPGPRPEDGGAEEEEDEEEDEEDDGDRGQSHLTS